MRIDTTRQDEPTTSVDLLRVHVTRDKSRSDLGDRRADNADVRQASAVSGDDLTNHRV